MSSPVHTGRCARGGVAITLAASLTEVIACHCQTCRRWSGHYWGAIRVARGAVAITGDSLVWWHSSARARRGFCRQCGASLFFDAHDAEGLGIAPGRRGQPARDIDAAPYLLR